MASHGLTLSQYWFAFFMLLLFLFYVVNNTGKEGIVMCV